MTQVTLDGHVALVTGASGGVGRATAIALAREGVEVYAAARPETALRELASEASSIHAVPCDATERTDVDRVVAALRERHDRLDLLVCAAGMNIPRLQLAELSLADWRRVMETNVTATFNAVQACLPLLRAASGLVIIVGSVSAAWPDASGGAYQASKQAILGLAHALALEESQVRVSVILPGITATPLLEARLEPPPAEVRAGALQAHDVAEVCLFLARLHPRVCIPELVVLPSALQQIGGL